MVSPEQDIHENQLTELANAVGNAVLVLNADIDGACFGKVLAPLNEIGETEILSLVLNSDGGSIEFAFRIAKAVRASCDKLEVLVPAPSQKRSHIDCPSS